MVDGVQYFHDKGKTPNFTLQSTIDEHFFKLISFRVAHIRKFLIMI